jgi:hypothetical protein
MFDTHAGTLAQRVPEVIQRLGRRRHAALADQLVKLVGGGCDAVAEKQQDSDLTVQVQRARKARLQLRDGSGNSIFIGLHSCFHAMSFGHERRKEYAVLRCKSN